MLNTNHDYLDQGCGVDRFFGDSDSDSDLKNRLRLRLRLQLRLRTLLFKWPHNESKAQVGNPLSCLSRQFVRSKALYCKFTFK